MTRLALAILLIMPALTLPAAAHSGPAPAPDFLAGFLHPLAGLDHLTAMLALGVWAGALGGRALWQWPLAFLLFLAVGAMTAEALPHLPLAEGLILGSALVLAALALFRCRFRPIIALPIIAVFASAHGNAHGHGLALRLTDLSPALGFILATAALHLLGMLLAYLTSRTEVRALRATS